MDPFRVLAEHSMDITFHTIGGVLEWVSPTVEETLGWKPEELVGRTTVHLWHPADRAGAVALLDQVHAGRPGRAVFRIRAKSGRYVGIETSLQPFVEADGTVGAVGSMRDMTAQIALEAARAEAEERFRLTMEHAPIGLCLVSPEGRFLLVNPALCQILGRDTQRLLSSTWQELTHPDDLTVDAGLIDDVAAGRVQSYQLRKRYLRPDGSVVWGDLSVACVRDNDGVPRYFISQIVNATERVRAEQALARREADLRAMAEGSADILVRTGPDREINYVSSAVTRVLGWEPAELLGASSATLWHPEDAAPAEANVALARSGVIAPFRARARCKDGTYRWIGARVTPLGGPDLPFGFVSVLRDEHELVLHERALAESEQHLRSLVSASAEALFESGPDHRVTWVSPAVTAILGWAPGELVGTEMSDLVHPDDRAEVETLIAEMYAGLEPLEPTGRRLTVRMRTEAGSYRWVSAWGQPMVDESGSLIRVVAGLQDIDELVTTRERLRATLDTEFDPHVVLAAIRDDDGRIVDFTYVETNPAACQYNGIARDDLLGARLLEVQPGHASPEVMDLYRHVVESGEPLRLDDIAYEQELKGGQTRRYDVQAARIGDGLSYTWRDVTERHATTEALAASEEMHRLLADNLSDVVVHLRDGVVLWVTPSLTTTMGWPPQDWLGHAVTEFAHPDDRADAEAATAAVGTGEVQHLRLRLQAKNLDHHWVQGHAKPFYDRSGSQDGVVISFRVADVEVAAEAALENRARSDALTGMMNRHEVLERVAAMTSHPRRTGDEAAVLFGDIDGFKEVNDEYGHSAGDDVLQTMAARVGACLRAGDIAARIGGDELLVLLDGVHDLADAVRIADTIRRAVSAPIPTAERQLVVTLSIGVTLAVPGESVDAMIARADQAMYRAKQAGGDRVMSKAADAV
ncbi:PAS domain S-box protein [Cellulomonas sp. KRMCY2]|uniref:sensor domain-containing diguanylate cyclase n=1 Tax=Cellulomonas sp. KRMCY2 TaxID=1304865 RepID=UPI0004B71CA7|nr:PAS domain S-box protein [Cellulomonas sp. KRMCY2]